MIQPTNGRIVWFYPASGDADFPPSGPFASIVTWVHSDHLINVCAFDGSGDSHGRQNVYLKQDEDENPAPEGAYCQWMPYQKGQAAKTEALEAKVQGSS